MKAKDLMIGDWVLFDHNPVRVAILGAAQDSLGLAVGDNVFGQLYSIIEPIPLTEEILEKNGFKQIGEKFIWGEIDNDLIEVTPSINNSYRIKISVADLMTACSIWCSYVHQLQHAMRLCGIEKEIEL